MIEFLKKNNSCILYYNFIDKLQQGTSASQLQQWMKWVGDQLGRVGEWIGELGCQLLGRDKMEGNM